MNVNEIKTRLMQLISRIIEDNVNGKRVRTRDRQGNGDSRRANN